MITQTKQTPVETNSSTTLEWTTYVPGTVEEAFAHWRALDERLDCPSVATSAAWVECWIQHYGDIVPFRILAAESNGTVRGMALITDGRDQKIGPVPLKSMHIGTAGEPQIGSVCVEYNRLLVEPEYSVQFASGLIQFVHMNPDWEQFHLDGFQDCDLEEWQSSFPDASIRSRDSRYYDLKAARDEGVEVISKLGKSTRANIRRQLRKYGALETEWAETLTQANDIFHEMVDLHQARWQAVGEPGAFAATRFRAFQEEVMTQLFADQRVVLFRVRHEGETVGCLMLLVDGNRLLDYLSGFASFEVKPSPGLISHYLCMNDANEKGFDAYDFLVGDKRHKENLSTHVNQLCWLTWLRPSWKVWSATRLRDGKRFLSNLKNKRKEG